MKELIEKYEETTTERIKQFPELKALMKPTDTTVDRIIKYLDWRDEVKEQGASAVYVLYAPVPKDSQVRDIIKYKRGDFLNNKVLLSTQVNPNELIPIGEEVTRDQINTDAFWILEWLAVSTKENALWFDGIPHAYFYPKDGYIHPKDIQVVPEKSSQSSCIVQ